METYKCFRVYYTVGKFAGFYTQQEGMLYKEAVEVSRTMCQRGRPEVRKDYTLFQREYEKRLDLLREVEERTKKQCLRKN